MVKIEIACFNAQSAVIAQEYGADRVELCAEMKLGGTTPSLDVIAQVRDSISIDLNIMIRPRGGDFVYTQDEFEQMRQEIITIKEMGVDGFVFGILNQDNTVNIPQNIALVELASPLPCTFHRAFDVVEDSKRSLEDVISCGFNSILTSAGQPNVEVGLRSLQTLVEWAGSRITIMPGGGLRSTNLELVLRETKATFFHSSAITDGTETAVPAEVEALKTIAIQ